MLRCKRAIWAGVGVVLASAAPASATWSILIVDTRTGEIALGSATCLTRLDLRELTPVLIAGVGGVTAQSAGDSTGRNRALIQRRLLEGAALDEILTELGVTDDAHQTRQYGMIDVSGEAVSFTGTQASDWAGGQTGRLGDLAWAVQGNILTGPAVVQDAVDAIVATEGDLAEKLMASMVAAREAGGDGRCSCVSGTPTGCGSPPPGEFKSAHIGYMLVARLGDQDASRTILFEPESPSFFATTDLNADGVPDILVSTAGGGSLHAYLNTTPSGGTILQAQAGPVIETGLTGIVDLTALPVLGGVGDDLSFLSASPDAIALMAGNGPGDFGAAALTPLPGPGHRLALGPARTDGTRQAAVSVPTENSVLVFEPNIDGWTQTGSVGVTGAPTGLALADIDGDGVADLVVTQKTLGRVLVLRDAGAGVFEPWADLPTGAGPVDAAVADLDLDGRADLVVSNEDGRSITVLSQTAPGVFEGVALPLLNRGVAVDIGDITGDGLADVVSLSRAPNGIEVFVNRGPAGLENAGRNRTGSFQNAVTLADLNADGLADIVSGQAQRGLTLMRSLGDGSFPPYNGFAAGAYHLALNVPDQLDASPDPVDQLAGEFASWRQSLEGRVDAVATTVVAPSRAEAGSLYTLRISARDWRGDPLTGVGALGAEITSNGVVLATTVRRPEPGVIEVDLTAPDAAGTALLAVRVGRDTTGGLADAVRLMPDTAVRTLDDLADFNADGRRDFGDLLEFVASYNASDPAADLDGNGLLEPADLAAFAQRFVGP